MGVYTLQGNPPIAVVLRRSTRARRMSLRVSRLDGRVTLSMPTRLPEREALNFLHEREGWLRGHLSQVQDVRVVRAGGSVLFEGLELPVIGSNVRRVIRRDEGLVVPQDRAGTAVKAYLRLRARDALAQASDDYAKALGRQYSKISLRDTRSRWGSCSSKGVLMYSWRLIMAPASVLRYVAAHEVAHLEQMNHSQAFWDVVEDLYGTYQPQRDWLRQNGDQLHRVQFDD